MNTLYIKTKGDVYEEYVLNYIRNNKSQYDNGWFYKDTPEYVIAKTTLYDSYDIYCKYRNCDIGADIVAIKNDTVYFIQCKNYNNIISINDLASFYFLIYENQLNGIVYYNGILSERLVNLSKNKVTYINLEYNNIHIDNLILKKYENNIIIPREYQLEAVDILKNENRSILNLPCGMGKTYTSYLIAKSFKNIIIIATTRTLTEELLYIMNNYFENKYNPLLISMDGSRDLKNIKLKLCESNIIASTYDSVDILFKVINELDDIIIIIDEYHNLSNNNLNDKKNYMNKILESNHKILFLSATLLEGYNNEKYFGNKIYKYSWINAIKNKYICDFKIIIPEYNNFNNIFEILLKNLDVDYEDDDIKLINKAYFLLRSILYNGSKKCIVYLTTIDKANKFRNIIEWMEKILNISIDIYNIDCNTSKIKRFEYINKFKLNLNISLILNVQILNEGIDIPICDSVYITNPNNNMINLIQRMSRANRIYKNKYECKIYLWCNENKTNKILSYINYQTNNEFNTKIYKYNFLNKNYTDIIIPNNNIENKIIKNINYNDFIDKIRNTTNIPQEFIDKFLLKINYENKNNFYINIDDIASFMNINSNIYRYSLIDNFKLNKDYIIDNSTKITNKQGGHNKIYMYLTYECFKMSCMMRKNKKFIIIIQYFNIIDKLLYENVIK